MRAVFIAPLILPAALALAACGTSQPDRTQGGAAAGAATGAAVGIVGGPVGVVAGAGIGAAGGAIAGATTSPSQVNLGKPVWDKDHQTTQTTESRTTTQ
jgi:hypothetical protein